MELKVEKYQLPSTITANWEEIKNEIAVKLKDYSVMTYTEDEIGRAKADKAYLNKLKKSINDERIRLEREYMRPFEDFKNASKEVIALIEQPIAEIDKQLKNYEEKRKEHKQMEIGSAFVCAEFPSWVRLSMIQNDKWLNATYKISDIKDELEFRKLSIEGELKTLEELSYGFEAIEEYKRTLDLNQAIREGQRISELQKRKEESQRANIPTTEEKPVETPQNDEMANWYSFGAFMTDTQIKSLKEWAKSQGIELMEV